MYILMVVEESWQKSAQYVPGNPWDLNKIFNFWKVRRGGVARCLALPFTASGLKISAQSGVARYPTRPSLKFFENFIFRLFFAGLVRYFKSYSLTYFLPLISFV